MHEQLSSLAICLLIGCICTTWPKITASSLNVASYVIENDNIKERKYIRNEKKNDLEL